MYEKTAMTSGDATSSTTERQRAGQASDAQDVTVRYSECSRQKTKEKTWVDQTTVGVRLWHGASSELNGSTPRPERIQFS